MSGRDEHVKGYVVVVTTLKWMKCLGVVINENCLLTLREINQELRRRLQVKPFVHDRASGKALDGMLVRVK